MNLSSLVDLARRRGASDIHLEPGLPLALRINGDLQIQGEPLSSGLVRGWVRETVGEQNWSQFKQRGSWDSARNIAHTRCRMCALTSMRGVGLVIRLLPEQVPTIESLNLHPTFIEFAKKSHGLVVVSGPTGSGKSSTIAALLHEINRTQARHIITIEDPIEYNLRPIQSLIRQREVGRDTPSFEQGLKDSLREDPDVLMVGEMRDSETMRLTLNAAETGRLVLTTVHSTHVVDAIGRILKAFPSDMQSAIASMLADCLQALICQQLVYQPDLALRLPECEVLTASSGARGTIRSGEIYKLPSVLETSGADGMWTRERYVAWLRSKTTFHKPVEPNPTTDTPIEPGVADQPEIQAPPQKTASVMVIDPPEADPTAIVSELEKKP